MSQITTHILDTTRGKPATGVPVTLYQASAEQWKALGSGETNSDGRITNLLPKEVVLQKGIYKLRFETSVYFNKNSVPAFYPFVEIVFDIQSEEHYHVPLLLNPFGYSTYRGS